MNLDGIPPVHQEYEVNSESENHSQLERDNGPVEPAYEEILRDEEIVRDEEILTNEESTEIEIVDENGGQHNLGPISNFETESPNRNNAFQIEDNGPEINVRMDDAGNEAPAIIEAPITAEVLPFDINDELLQLQSSKKYRQSRGRIRYFRNRFENPSSRREAP